MMIGLEKRERGNWPRVLGLAAAFGLVAGAVAGRCSAAARRWTSRPPAHAVVRQVIIRREPVVIEAVTLAQLRGELRRARLAQVGYERQIAQQYQTIRRLQSQLDLRLREGREFDARRADQLNAQFELILQAFGLVVFAIIGALLVALCRSGAAPSLPVVDWDPLQRQLREAKGALARVESRLRRLEMGVPSEGS